VWEGLSNGLTDVLWGSLIVSMILWICFLIIYRYGNGYVGSGSGVEP
jgi:hypothetical protein